MNRTTSDAIIMQVREFGESDLIITFFTPDHGKMKGIAKGAKRSRNRFVNCLDIFSLVSLDYTIKKKTGLHFINSGKLTDAFPGLRKNYKTLVHASYITELTDLLSPWELADPAMFSMLKDTFRFLAENNNMDIVHVLFEIAAMSLGGFGINLEKCCICGRKYTGAGTAVFKPDKGAIACMKCQNITGTTPAMSPETVRAAVRMQKNFSYDPECVNLSYEAVREIKKVLKLHREYRLEKKPKSGIYID